MARGIEVSHVVVGGGLAFPADRIKMQNSVIQHEGLGLRASEIAVESYGSGPVAVNAVQASCFDHDEIDESNCSDHPRAEFWERMACRPSAVIGR